MNPQRVCGSGRATPSLHHTLSDMHKDIINQYDAIWHKLRGDIIINRLFSIKINNKMPAASCQ